MRDASTKQRKTEWWRGIVSEYKFAGIQTETISTLSFFIPAKVIVHALFAVMVLNTAYSIALL
jgi:hypothetical protein